MAAGASVLADGGVLRQVHSVFSVSRLLSHQLYQADPSQAAKQVIDPRVSFVMDQIMSDDSNRAMIFGHHSILTLPDQNVASKTGTTDDYKDGWTVGFTPDIASAFWFGNPDWTAMPVGAEASLVAAPVWHNFMQWATDTVLKEPARDWFLEPPGLDHHYVRGKLQWFLPGTSPRTVTPPIPAALLHPRT
jgi:membrane peptidoglycan carboxypeptidase